MKHVWKCDFCFDTFDISEECQLHEDSCTFNPKQKTCHTCGNHRVDGYGWDDCLSTAALGRKQCPDVEKCIFWIPEE